MEYALSETGESMRPILNAMYDWGTNYNKNLSKNIFLLRFILISISFTKNDLFQL